MFCPKCGSLLREGIKICTKCGSPLNRPKLKSIDSTKNRAKYKQIRDVFFAICLSLCLYFLGLLLIALLDIGVAVFFYLLVLLLIISSLITCYYWAKYKRLHAGLIFVGFLGPIGFIIMTQLKDNWDKESLRNLKDSSTDNPPLNDKIEIKEGENAELGSSVNRDLGFPRKIKTNGVIYCVKCGAQLTANNFFCRKCGTKQS